MFSQKQHVELLVLARQSIENYLQTGELPKAATKDPAFSAERATFVTLTKNGELRGCIGSIEPHRGLADDVANNAISAAVGDPRFPPVSVSELPEIKIEISVLTPPKKLEYRDAEDLLEKMEPGKTGVILSEGFHTATYLPQVWEELPNKTEFLGSLCLKAGLPSDSWKSGKLGVQIYAVEKFKET